MMRTYLGSQISVHHPGNHVKTYHTDVSGRVDYDFNDFGFRFTRLEEPAPITIWTIGCSLTFGTGLHVEDTWSNRMARLVAGHTNKRICLFNFSQGGASNDYIFRTLWDQFQLDRPSLVIIQLTYVDRAEYLNESIQGEMIGRWNNRRVSSSYYKYYDKQIGLVNLAKNIILLTLALEKRGVKYIFTPVEMPLGTLEMDGVSEIPQRLFETIDTKCFMHCNLWDSSSLRDIAADGLHPGPLTNLSFASDVMSKIIDFEIF